MRDCIGIPDLLSKIITLFISKYSIINRKRCSPIHMICNDLTFIVLGATNGNI